MKLRPTTYTFDASARTIDCASFTSLEAIQLITNVTDNVIIYNFADPTKGGSLTSTTLTLTYDTSSMADTDKLQILIETGSTTESISGTVTANAGTNLNTSALALETGGNLAAIKAKTDNIPAQGQALAAASLPVVLPAAQITTLTPPAAITGFATAAKQDTLDSSINSLLKPASTLAAVTSITNVVHVDDNSGSLTVDGTVTANLSATDNAVLDDIASDTEAIKTALAGTLTVTGGGGGVEYTEGDTDASITGSAIMFESNTGTNALAVVSNTTPLPISDAGGTLTVDGTVAVTNAGITTIAGAVSGTEMQVDVITMPTTTVQATDLDIRNLTNVDVVTAELSATDNAVLDTIAAKDFATETTLAAMNAKLVTGTDIGDVTINNASGASAVNIQDGGNTITVDGSVTANAGTNLNTSALAVETGGNLAAAATSLAIIDDGIVSQATALGTNKVRLVGASVTTSAPTYTTGQINPLNMATTGALRVDIGATSANSTAVKVNVASGGIASGAIAAGAIAAGATAIAANEDDASAAGDRLVKIAGIRLDTPVANANVSASGDYTQLAVDNTQKLWVTGAYAEDTAHADADRIIANGSRRIDTPASSAGTSGDYATMDSSAEGALWTTLTPTTTGGCAIFRSLDLDESEEEVKASAGNVYGYYFANLATSIRYLKFYNATAANTTVGTTTPVCTFPLPAGAAANVALPYAIGFSTAICAAATTGIADNDTGAPGSNEVVVNIFYK